MKKNILILINSFLVLTFSCDNEEITKQEATYPADEPTYKTEKGALEGLNAAYDILQLGEEVERIEFVGTVCSGDAMVGGEPGAHDGGIPQSVGKFLMRTDHPYALEYWRAMYRGIYRCNLLLHQLASPIDDFDDHLRNRIIGETIFLRGLFHFKLQILYGGYPQLQDKFNGQLKGVPFVDQILKPDEWDVQRPELSYTWERIEEDFQAAGEKLPRKSEYGTSDIGRATQGAARAMLAKTYLYQEEWQKAYETAKAVIESDEYWLPGEDAYPGPFTVTRLKKNGPVEELVSGYEYIWQPEANNSPESIFSVQHHQTGETTYPQGQEGSLVPQYYGPRAAFTLDLNGDTVETELFWGFILPTDYFVKTAYKDIGCETADGTILDPRYTLTVAEPDDYYRYYYENDTLRERHPDSAQFSPWYQWPYSSGYSTRKYFTDPYYTRQMGSFGDHPQNTKYLRFADLLLIGAEAAVNSGYQNDALKWVNRVRERARNAGNTGYPEPLTTVTKADIWNERRVELAFEGHQFFDIVRTGRAEQILKNEAMQYAHMTNPETGEEGTQQFGDDFEPGKEEIWPIPEEEIELTGGNLTQNPNYNE